MTDPTIIPYAHDGAAIPIVCFWCKRSGTGLPTPQPPIKILRVFARGVAVSYAPCAACRHQWYDHTTIFEVVPIRNTRNRALSVALGWLGPTPPAGLAPTGRWHAIPHTHPLAAAMAADPQAYPGCAPQSYHSIANDPKAFVPPEVFEQFTIGI